MPVSELDTDKNPLRGYVLGNEYISQVDGNSFGYYLNDEQGSVRYLTGSDGSIRNHYRYSTFGETITAEETVPNRLRYNGQMADGLTGLYYLRARYYNASLGRFTQEDVIYNDGLNLYAYCNNNPVMYSDPSGFEATPTQQSMCKRKNGGEKDSKSGRVSINLRYERGTVTGSEGLYDVDKMMRGSQGNIGIIPKEIGEKLQGRTINNFDYFREALWYEIGHSKYADEFSLGNRTLMKREKAPFAVPKQWNGKNGKYVIHHRKPIHDVGGVYDLGNIVISTPRFHLDILDRNYHFNK